MNVSVSYYKATGKREKNEDEVSLLESNGGILAIVADGLGGHSNGELASRQAVVTMNKLLQAKAPDENELVQAIRQASWDIYEMRPQNEPMHTTVAALWLGDKNSFAANVGDSRIYQFRGGKILYQSLDHSVAQMAVLVGEMDAAEIRESKDRNRLIRVLGDGRDAKVDVCALDIKPGDALLLCSDGFWEAVTEEDMLSLLSDSTSVHHWIERMRALVEERGKPTQDNHTAIAIWVKKDS